MTHKTLPLLLGMIFVIPSLSIANTVPSATMNTLNQANIMQQSTEQKLDISTAREDKWSEWGLNPLFKS